MSDNPVSQSLDRLAIEGGQPVRTTMLPYGRQSVDDDDIAAVIQVLTSDWLTTGPVVAKFEQAIAGFVGTDDAVAVSSGTAALHAAMFALAINTGNEVIVPAVTFAATANCVVYQGGTPVFADVDPETLLLDPLQVEKKITERTKAIIAVDFAGQPCDYDALTTIAEENGLALVADACHALGATYRNNPVGQLTDLSTFSFHPVKHITTAEGGMVTTNDPELAQKMRIFRNHGITTDHRERAKIGLWFYEQTNLGYNYRLSDVHCALGLSQLRKLPEWVARRQAIAQTFDDAFADLDGVQPLRTHPDITHAYHLYVVQLDLERLGVDRNQVFSALRAEGIGVNVHYVPVHLHPYYRRRFGTGPGLCPIAESATEQILSLPMFPLMSERDCADVVTALNKVVKAYLK